MVLVGCFCVVGAVGLLIVGLVQSDPDLVWASIGASGVGGIAVAIASMQRSRALRKVLASAAATKAAAESVTDKHSAKQPVSTRVAAEETAAKGPELEAAAQARAEPDVVNETDSPHPARAVGTREPGPDEHVGDTAAVDPEDEPAEEDVDMADLLVIIDRTDEVLVVDLRPRYHLAACAHLHDRDAVPIPVNEAREDGFTPCGLCRPDAALAAAARLAKVTPADRALRPRPHSSL
ncbi:MAG: hypothetical protein M3400_11400 [Actinomycetota bacterium]|nr:hypothetical protein [Actinomycetota bacterium]